tara:strand:+ start:3960 stop:4289 length:330 start_codon:yes stop_codon:yes gene_type:complete
MALVKPVLDTAITNTLNAAFAAAMTDFVAVIKSGPATGNDSEALNLTAAITSSSLIFSNLAGPGISAAVDAYIRSQTLIVPPGQLVTTAGSAAAQAGATSAPSPPIPIL